MRILAVYANINNLLKPPPVGLMLVVQNALSHGHEAKILDFMTEKNPDEALLSSLKDFKPDLVAFSFRNLDNQDMLKPVSYVSFYRKWVAAANLYAPTVIGGSAFTTYPLEMMLEIPATYGIAGQAESTFSDFLDELISNKSSFNTPGVWWRENNKLHNNPVIINGYPEDKGKLNWDLVDIKKYKDPANMSYSIITKTGCPYHCLFCDTKVTFGGSFVPRDPDSIVDELKENQKKWRLNRNGYFFIDDLLNDPIDWCKTLLEKIIQSDVKIAFGAVIEPTVFDRELFSLLVKAGCVMGTGLVLSASDRVLAENKKTFTKAHLSSFIELSKKEKFSYMPQYMLGLPGETEDTIRETIDFAISKRLIMTDIGLGARIQRQTQLYDIAVNKGIISAEANLLFPGFYWEPGLSLSFAQGEVKRFRKKRKTAYNEWIRMFWRMTKVGFQN